MSRLLDLADALAQKKGVDLDITHPEIQKLESLLNGIHWRAAHQPSWPLRANVEALNLINDEVREGEGKVPVFYIALSNGVGHDERPYADRDLFRNQDPFYTDVDGEEEEDDGEED
jgi:hypothetical protein